LDVDVARIVPVDVKDNAQKEVIAVVYLDKVAMLNLVEVAVVQNNENSSGGESPFYFFSS
jgi:hypothetical protein